MQRTVLITGVGGFTGRHLVQYLRSLSQPLKLVGLDCRAGAVKGLDAFHVLDLNDVGALTEFARQYRPARVLHLAGVLPPAPEGELWRVNVGGTQALLRALAAPGKNRHLRVLSVGSAAEYLRSSRRLRETDLSGGETPYGRSKWAQSAIALASGREFGIDVMIARTFNLLGPGLPPTLVAGSLCAQFSRCGSAPVKVGDVRPRRDFVDVRDAVRAYWQICERGKSGGIYNVCTGRSTAIRTIVQNFSRLSGNHRPLETDRARSRTNDIDSVSGRPEKLRRLGWSPSVSVAHSVRDMLEWARSS